MLYQFNFIEGVYDIDDEIAEKLRKEINNTNEWINGMKDLFKALVLCNPIFDRDGIPSHMRDEFDNFIMKAVCKIVEKYFLKHVCCYCYTQPISDELEMYEAKIIKLEES